MGEGEGGLIVLFDKVVVNGSFVQSRVFQKDGIEIY